MADGPAIQLANIRALKTDFDENLWQWSASFVKTIAYPWF